MSSVVKNVSFHELMQYPEVKKIIEEGDVEEFEKVLYKQWGIDTNDPYEILSCEHRPYEGNPFVFNGPLVLASERLDEEWLKNEDASWDARVEACKDSSLRAELKHIGRQGCADKTFVNESTAKRVAQNEAKKGM